jgi:hypothetical protein
MLLVLLLRLLLLLALRGADHSLRFQSNPTLQQASGRAVPLPNTNSQASIPSKVSLSNKANTANKTSTNNKARQVAQKPSSKALQTAQRVLANKAPAPLLHCPHKALYGL